MINGHNGAKRAADPHREVIEAILDLAGIEEQEEQLGKARQEAEGRLRKSARSTK